MIALLLILIAFSADVTDDETIRRTLRFADDDAPRYVVVDNVDGRITVTAYDGDTVELVAHRRTTARTDADLERARRDVRLEIEQIDNEIILFVNTPNRRGRAGRAGLPRYGSRDDGYGERERRYEVTIDFELRVPRRTSLDLRTINDGAIEVAGVEGHHYVKNINNGITLSSIRGSSDIYALNGDVAVSFRDLPTDDCRFGSLNGDVEVTLPPGLNALVRTKTFNGEVYTNLDLAYAPQTEQRAVRTAERNGTRYVYKREGFSSFRAGSGGPTLTFDAFNGDIRLIERR